MSALLLLYLSGSLLAVLVELVRLALAALRRWSILEQNLRRVGATQDLVTREVVFEDESGVGSVVLALVLAGILSWVSPVWVAVQILRAIWSKITTPREVRLIQWRMRHVTLSGLDVALNLIQMREVLSGHPPSEDAREQFAIEVLCALAKRRRLIPNEQTRENLKFAEGIAGRSLTP